MSKTTTVEFAGTYFWVFSDSLSVLLALAVAVAEDMPVARRPAGFDDVTYELRVSAIVTDFGFTVHEDWRGGRLDLLAGLVEEAARRLGERERVTAAEVAGWTSLDGEVVELRSEAVDTAPVVELARGVLALLRERLPAAPEGTWWFYGVAGGRQTIRMRES